MRCAAAYCDGTDKSKSPLDCFHGFDQKYEQKDQDQINSSFCSMIESPTSLTRKALLSHLADPHATEDEAVENVAYLLAITKSPQACKDHIKSFIGNYGSQWNYQWYRAMSGCRILGHQRTREQEEKDYYMWHEVSQGFGNCSSIPGDDIRKACNVPGVRFPSP